MYVVTIRNGGSATVIHDTRSASNAQKLLSGNIVDGVNAISSFTFEINPHNAGYELLNAYTTSVEVYNTLKQRFDFVGRVLQINPTMTNDGTIRKRVICEDKRGYLQDSIQPFAALRYYEGDGNRTGLEEFIDAVLGNHNAQVEPYKRIQRGLVTVQPFESSNNVSKQLNYESTWDCLNTKLVDAFGGYLVLRDENGVLYLDYLANMGATHNTRIEVARNMLAASKTVDATHIITRLIPLGAKLKTQDENGNMIETEERLTIESVNDGSIYIESPEYYAQFGARYATVYFDDVTDPANLLTKGMAHLAANNGLNINHDIDALDLSLLGLDIDDFRLCDSYPVINPLIGIDDVLQIVKKTTNVTMPQNSSFELGTIQKRLSDTVIDYSAGLQTVRDDISTSANAVKAEITNNVYSYVEQSISNIKQDADSIWAAIENRTITKSEYDTFTSVVRNILQMEADGTTMLFETIAESIAEVGGVEASHYAELIRYIRFVNGSIILGEEGNAVTLTLENDVLTFKNNGVTVAYFTDNTLYVTDGRFLKSVRIGNYGFIPEQNGSVSFTYLGGGE